MQDVSPELESALLARSRWLSVVVEFYGSDETDITNPANAVARFAKSKLTWNGIEYQRELVSVGAVNRYMGTSINTASLTFSNVSRRIAGFVLGNQVQGMRAVIRIIARNVTNSSVVVFVGRAEKPETVNRQSCTINLKQDLGSLEVEIPPRTLDVVCPLEFQHGDCLGPIPLTSHSLAYQDATICNKSKENCIALDNEDLFQGIIFVALNGTFVTQHVETKRFLLFFTKKKVVYDTNQWSSEDDTPMNTVVPFILGRVQLQLLPIQHADVGSSVKFQEAIGEGEIAGITNLRPVNVGFGTPTSLTLHRGEFGGVGAQTEDALFPGSGKFSRLAYVCGETASSVDAVDPAPDLVCVIQGQIVPLPDGSGDYTLTGWSDNPAHLLRFVFTDPRLANFPADLIDDAVCLDTANFCDQSLIDDSNGERVFLPDTVTADAGVTFRRLNSTGLIDTGKFRRILGLDGGDPDPVLEDADYEFFPVASPPATIAPVRFYRRRYTMNVPLVDRVKLADFIWNTLLPSFRGYLVTGANGKLQIRSERPADSVLLRNDCIPGDTLIPVEDISYWQASLKGKVLIGVGLTSSEVRKVQSVQYSTAGNSVTLSAAATGTLTLTASGGSLIGGTTSTPATGSFTVGGALLDGAQVVATIDGIPIAYTQNSGDTLGTIAAMLSTSINSDPTLKRYLVASWSSGTPTVVTLTAKLGSLVLDEALSQSHTATEEVIRVMMSFTKAVVRPGTFNWPVGNQQPTVNQIIVPYREASADFAPRELRVNDYDHQRQVKKKYPLTIDGSAIDNFHQASRVGNAAIAKYREGDFFFELESSGEALLLEEGDVICASDDSGGWVNVPCRVEQGTYDCEGFNAKPLARLYSTNMFSDVVAQKTIPLPTIVSV